MAVYFRSQQEEETEDTAGRSTDPNERTCSYAKMPYICDVCGKSFKYKSGLNLHCRVLHAAELDLPTCQECGQTFMSVGALGRHKQIHNKKNAYFCDICGKKCPSPSKVMMHKTAHSTVKPYICDICGNSYKQLGHMNYHRSTHTIPKPSCCVCGEEFTRDRFKVIYRGPGVRMSETQFSCSICAKSSKETDVDDARMSQVTKEKLYIYACNICGKVFIQPEHLEKHDRTHTTKTPSTVTLLVKDPLNKI